jgi:alanine dehydrogenase
MKIGVPKEIKTLEFRVGLVPPVVHQLTVYGHQVFVEAGAGAGIGQSDEDYKKAGATILPNADEVFKAADMIVKVKEPQAIEWRQLREGQILFTYLHLAPDSDQAKGLLASGCTAIAYETVTDANGGLPLLAPMSEVAGRLAIEAAGAALRKSADGMGKLIGGVPGVAPARIAVIGGGVVGTHAARMAAGLGADIVILDRSLPRLRLLDELFAGRVRTCYATLEAIDQAVIDADVVIGAVLVPGASAPKLVDRAHLSRMRRRAVLVDVAIDQGGCFETSRPTTHQAPTFLVDEVVHYCVANMPGAVPVTSSHALNNATLPFGLALAAKGIGALVEDRHLRAGLNIYRGQITNRAVAESLHMAVAAPEEVLAA